MERTDIPLLPTVWSKRFLSIDEIDEMACFADILTHLCLFMISCFL